MAFKSDVARHLATFFNEYPSIQRIWIAYSGGVDSHVLLHSVTTYFNCHLSLREGSPVFGCHLSLREGSPVFGCHLSLREGSPSSGTFSSASCQAIHVNHHLHPDADKWAEHCQQVCAALDVPLIIKDIDLSQRNGESLEAQAREKRYKVFADLMREGDALCTAHHCDDQAETLLLQLFRGAGPKGLSAMPDQKALGDGVLLRPFLSLTRETLLAYAKQHHLVWIEDESNTDLRFDRNRIRHRIMPEIRARWPSISTTLKRVSKHCAEATTLLETLAKEDLAVCASSKGTETLSVSALLALSGDRRRNLLRYWFHLRKLPTPSEVKLNQITPEVLRAGADRTPCLIWPGAEVRRYRDALYADKPLAPHDVQREILWDGCSAIDFPELSAGLEPLTPELLEALGLNLPKGKSLTIRFRRGGEACRPKGRNESHTLKALFQTWGIPPWLRDRIPLLYLEDQLICVWGYCVCDVE